MNTADKSVLNQLRRAFGLADDFRLTDFETEELRGRFSSIFPYAILFTARSGSTFLTHELRQARVLSVPEEWFNWSNIGEMAARQPMTPKRYILKTVLENASANGVFGVELTWHQLASLAEIVPIEKLFLHKIKWFCLRRRNLLAQAVSHYIASESGIYHSYQLQGSSTERRAVDYDVKKIKRHVLDLLAQEVAASDWMMSRNISPVNIYYEDLACNMREAVLLFANVIGAALPAAYLDGSNENPIKKIATGLNIELEERFRSEEGDFIDSVRKKRPPVLVRAESI